VRKDSDFWGHSACFRGPGRYSGSKAQCGCGPRLVRHRPAGTPLCRTATRGRRTRSSGCDARPTPTARGQPIPSHSAQGRGRGPGALVGRDPGGHRGDARRGRAPRPLRARCTQDQSRRWLRGGDAGGLLLPALTTESAPPSSATPANPHRHLSLFRHKTGVCLQVLNRFLHLEVVICVKSSGGRTPTLERAIFSRG
jgi:hypothetical protein